MSANSKARTGWGSTSKEGEMTELEPKETLAQFDRREGAYPEPLLGTQEEAVKARAKGRRSALSGSVTSINSREETETGRALADWWIKLVEVWVACDALPPDQRAVMRLYFLTEHRCEGSGRLVGKEYARGTVHCPDCGEYDPEIHDYRYSDIRVDARGLLVEHNRQYGNEDVARALGRSTRWVTERKREAIEVIKVSIWPPKVEGAD